MRVALELITHVGLSWKLIPTFLLPQDNHKQALRCRYSLRLCGMVTTQTAERPLRGRLSN